MAGDIDPSHPARKVDPENLKKVLAKRNETVPAITARGLAADYPADRKQQTLGDNLDRLSKAGEVCKFNDGDVNLYWMPRRGDDGGTVTYSELLDDSIDWNDIDIHRVPMNVAKKMASERLPFYSPRTFWTMMREFSELGILATFGLVVLGIGGLIGNSYGLSQNSAAQILQWGINLAFIMLIFWLIFTVLDILSARGRVPIDPLTRWRDSE